MMEYPIELQTMIDKYQMLCFIVFLEWSIKTEGNYYFFVVMQFTAILYVSGYT